MRLSKLTNIGVELERLLNDVGINDSKELMKIGSVEATYKLNLIDEACFNKLYAIEGAIQNVRWYKMPREYREELKEEYLKRISEYQNTSIINKK